MGFTTRDKIIQNYQNQGDASLFQLPDTGNEAAKPAFLETLGAAFRQENPLTSVYKYLRSDTDSLVTDLTFDPFINIQGTPYEQYAESFVYADSDAEVEAVKARIDQQLKDRDILDRSGWTGIAAMMFAGIVDPTILIPGTTAVKAISKGAKFAKGALFGAGTGAVATGIQESVLTGTQDTRTTEETLIRIAAGTVLGGVIGGAAGVLSKPVREAAETEIKEIIENVAPKPKILPLEPRSVGAAEDVLDAAEEGLAGIGKVGGVGERAARRSFIIKTPITEGLTSPSPQMRRFTSDLFQHNFILGKNLKGRASPVALESLMKQDEAAINVFQRQVKNAYLKYSGLEGKPFRNVLGAVAPMVNRSKLSFHQFNEEVAKAMRRGDLHEIAEVQEIAQLARKKIDEVFINLQKLDLMPAKVDIKTAKSYLTRQYNVNKIIENRGKFKDIITKYLQRTNKNLGDELEARAKADDIIDNILGLGDQSLGISEVASRVTTKSIKPTKARVFEIPDLEIEEFLLNDADRIISQYLYQGSGLTRFHQYLADKGMSSAGELKQALRDDYTRLMKGLDAKESAKLANQMESDFKLLDDSVRILLGQFNRTSNTKTAAGLQLLRKYQAMRLLGQVVISSFPDVIMPILRHGLPRSLRQTLSTFADLFSKTRFTKESVDELKHLGIGMEHEMNNILRALQDTNYVPTLTGSRLMDRLQRGTDVASETFNKATGLAYWNSFWRRVSGQLSLSRTWKAIVKGANAKETQRLRELGIDDSMQERIMAMFKKYGETRRGTVLAGLDKWSDTEAAETLGAAIIRDTDATILIPGKGDIPRIVQESELAKTMFQFKSFIAAASNKILLRGLQQRDARVAMGITGLIGVGYATYAIKEKIRGRSIDTSFDKMITEGVARSGVAGLIGDVGLALFGSNGRYAGVNTQSILFGPSMNQISDTYQALRGAADGDLSESDVKKITRILPFQNLFYLRILLKQLQD